MDGAPATLVTGIQCRKHVTHLAPSTLSQHDPIGPHSHGSTHQIAHRNLAGALHIRVTHLEMNNMGMSRAQFRRLFNHENPLTHRDLCQERGQQRRFP